MRGSTAAGINISLLPRDCSCGEFACSAVWGRDLFPAFVGNLPVELYRKRLLFPGICGIWHFWHFWHLWHSAHSVPETPSCGTEYAPGAQNSLLWYRMGFRKPSVLKTGFYGTEGIFGTGNPLLWYGADIRCAKQPSVVCGAFSGHSVHTEAPSVFLRAKGGK